MGLSVAVLPRNHLFRVFLFAVLVAVAGCSTVLHETERSIYDASALRSVRPWAGTYSFLDGDSRYVITVNKDGSTSIKTGTEKENREIETRGWAKDDTLSLQFRAYSDQKWYSGWVPKVSLGLGPGLKVGQRLVALVREGGSKICLHFLELKSASGTETICEQTPANK
jgi:hypothetical protein